MLEIIRNAIKIKELRKKILMTVMLVVIFRVGCYIPVPGLSKNALESLSGSGLFAFMNVITGGAMRQASLFAMGITPYINASIIMQLLTVAIPALEKMQKEGEDGRKKIAKITRYVTIALGLFQAIMLYFNLFRAKSVETVISGAGSFDIFTFLIVLASFTAGTAFLMWLGEKITEIGVGNGISMIIFAGIVANAPRAFVSLYNIITAKTTDNASGGNPANLPLYGRIIMVVVVLAVFLAVITAVVWMESAERKVPVQYAKRVVGRKMYGGQNTHIPLKVNSSGVLPIIFAMSLLQFPATIAGFINTSPNAGSASYFLQHMTSYWWYYLIYGILIVAFTFFYNIVYFDPVDIANNLKKNGGFVPGYRPGKPTADFIRGISTKITWFGAIFLAFLALFPSIIQGISFLVNKDISINLWFGGTSVLILVGVALETVRQIESQMLMRHYKGFLE
ncbi:MAG: preprotein translocase subunit SecY [Clostridiales bacterium]|jgi:preprotein translocase subunit SecY|nr:preprotein translocase subunit SecY [Clostridiales bacterium]